MHCFVILHYKGLSDTLECISSVRNVVGDKKIIVVDNASLSSDEALVIKKKVDDLIILDENLGFAKANNLGVLKALEYDPDFVSVINNDTVILDCNWIDKVQSSYDALAFDVMGPKIISGFASGSVNPYLPLKSYDDVLRELKYQRRLLFIYKSSFLSFLLRIYLGIKKRFLLVVLENGSSKEENVALHGCALIFAKRYLKKYSAFCDDTFLYHEEDFLYHRMVKEHLTFVYDPSLEILHKEGKSLEFVSKSLVFRTENVIKSLEKLLKVWEE